MNDTGLLERFARDGSAEAFRELVARHTNFVYSCACQRLHDTHAAQDVTQAVFLALALKAKGLSPDTPLPGWLFKATRYACAKHQRGEQRRKEREMHASDQLSAPADASALWTEIEPHLAAALDELPDKDREAVFTRFYRQGSYRDVAAVLQTTEDSARKRVDRALEKLRAIFTKKGIVLSAAGLGGLLAANAVQAAPTGLATTCAGLAAGGTLASTSTLMLAKGALHAMFIAQVKTVSLAAAACLVVAGTSVVVATQRGEPQPATVPVAQKPVVTPSSPTPVPAQHAQTAPTPTATPTAPAAPAPLRFTEDVNSKTVTMKVGQTFEVVLQNDREGAGWEENGTIGASVEDRNKPRQLNCDEFTPADATPDTTRGTYLYRYRAVKSGTSVIQLRHLYPSGPRRVPRSATQFIGEFKLVVEVIADGAAAAPAVNEYLAQQTAQLWVNGLLAGRVDQILAVSDVPFGWDKVEVVKTAEELKAKLEAVVQNKGARNLVAGAAIVLKNEEAASATEWFKKMETADLTFVTVVVEVAEGKKAGITVAIKPGNQLKVVGFAD